MQKNKNFSIAVLFIIVAVLIVAGLVFFYVLNKKTDKDDNQNLSEDILIGFSITSLQEERWQKDKSEFIKYAEEQGAVVDLQVAQNDASKQISQIENMIVNGVDVIVIVPYKADALTDVIKKAHEAGIKVISYDRLAQKANSDIYVSFDNEKVGEFEAKYVIDSLSQKIDSGYKAKIAYVGGSPSDNNAFLVKNGSMNILKPLIDLGKIEIVYDNFTPDWNSDKAYKGIKDYLVKSGNKIDGIVAANDGTAFGSISALKEVGLSGKVPVSGQDAELAALQRIVAGTQTVTVYKPIHELSKKAVELAIKLAKGEEIETTKTTNDGEFDVPSVLLSPTAVTKDNIDDTVIKDGYQKKEDVYR